MGGSLRTIGNGESDVVIIGWRDEAAVPVGALLLTQQHSLKLLRIPREVLFLPPAYALRRRSFLANATTRTNTASKAHVAGSGTVGTVAGSTGLRPAR